MVIQQPYGRPPSQTSTGPGAEPSAPKGARSSMSSLLTFRRLLLPVESVVLRREFRHTMRELAGMRRFGAELARNLNRSESEVSSFIREARAFRSVRDAARRQSVPLPALTLAYAESLYAIVRAAAPKSVVETGVWKGITTGYMLEALRRNGDGGRLISIDLPTLDPKGSINADGVVDRIHVDSTDQIACLIDPATREDRSRWELRLGDAKQLLPQLLTELPEVDLFYHDSEHSYQHMSFEFGVVWPKIRPGGLLVSDDISFSAGARRAWSELVAGAEGAPWTYFRPDGSRGVLRKRSPPGGARTPGQYDRN